MSAKADLKALGEALLPLMNRGSEALREAHHQPRPAPEMKGFNDFVTVVDRRLETLLSEGLRALTPHIPIVGEESFEGGAIPPEAWIVDPLDGTTNFLHGLPLVAISVGLIREGKPVLGAVSLPLLNRLFWGGPTMGATQNNTPIRVSNQPLAQSLLATGFPFKHLDRYRQFEPTFEAALKASRGVRRMGSAAMDLCYTAAGHFGAFWEFGLCPWDITGGWAILEGAGGIVKPMPGSENPMVSGDILAGGAVPIQSLEEIFHAVDR